MFRATYLNGLAEVQLDIPHQGCQLGAADDRRRWLRRSRKNVLGVVRNSPLAGSPKLIDYLGR